MVDEAKETINKKSFPIQEFQQRISVTEYFLKKI
jgi:hypothetical protein